MSDALKIIPLGGLGEIGKNMTVFEYGRDIMIVDVGVMFPANDMLGIDLVLPDSHMQNSLCGNSGVIPTVATGTGQNVAFCQQGKYMA